MKDKQIEFERYDIAKILADNFTKNDEGFDESDFEWSAFQLQEAGYHKQEWISVEDRLPEDNETVLTIDTESKMEVCFYQTEWKGVFQRYCGFVKIFNITHWMPLPEAPKGEEP